MAAHQTNPDSLRIACACLPASADKLSRNLEVLQEAVVDAKKRGADLVVFGEAFLSGFDSLSFNYMRDAMKALFIRGVEITKIRSLASEHHLAIGFGFYENDNGYLYSSYLVIDRYGDIQGHYRRASKGWRKTGTCFEYQEGRSFITFKLGGKNITILICGDLWEDGLLMPIIDRDPQTDLFLWPVHCDYPLEEWYDSAREDYRERSQILTKPVLLVNNYLEEENRAKGGVYLWHLGRELASSPYGEAGLFVVEV
ncbi:MAG: carbon-nitrogen hydrolase family protein [Saccharofermentanales bacterium]